MDRQNDFPRAWAAASAADDDESIDAELKAQAQARVGTILREKYHLDGVLGVGGMAVVYVATHRNRQSFAIKMLHPVLSLNAALRARFLGEGYRANSVKHRGAVKVFDDDIAEDGAVFLVMELLDGASLDRVLERRRTPLPARAVLAIGYQLLDVLVAAHAANVVHRDLKPANLFVTHDGTLKVLDFGIARLLDAAGAQMTRTGAVMGTPAFMAPEQARGTVDEIDGKTDTWAAGATLFALATGGLVHEGPSQQMLLVKAATEAAPSLATRAPRAPRGLVELVDRALSFDKAARPDATAMREAIRATYVAEYGEDPAAARLFELLAVSDSRPMVPAPGGTIPLAPGGVGRTATFSNPSPAAIDPALSTTDVARQKGGRLRWIAGAILCLGAIGAGVAWKVVRSGCCVDVTPALPEAARPAAPAPEPDLKTGRERSARSPSLSEHPAAPVPEAPVAPGAAVAPPAVPAAPASAPPAANLARPARPRPAPGKAKLRSRSGADTPAAVGAPDAPRAPSNPLDMPLLQ